MFNSQYYKVWRDMTHNKGRSALVVLSIVLGVFAIGLTMGSRTMLTDGMSGSYLAANPAEFTVGTSELVGDDFISSLVKDPEIADAYGRRSVDMRIKTGPESWQDVVLFVLEDTADIRVGNVEIESGNWPPVKGNIFIERNGLSMINAELGDSLVLETTDGRQQELQVEGVTFDVIQFASGLSGDVYGYVDSKTLAGFGVAQPHLYNELHVSLANDKLNQEHIYTMLDQVQEKIESSGMFVTFVSLEDAPGQHGAQPVVEAIGMLLVVLGLLTLALAAFLIANTMSAMMGRQIQQIGVMKTVGASKAHLIGMFVIIPLTYGVLALLIALPLSLLGARFLADFIFGIVNFDAVTTTFPAGLWILQISLGILVPLLAALLPIIIASRTSVREAIDNSAIKGGTSDSLISRIFVLVTDKWMNLSRPLIISLQNTFRRRGRLVFTLIALTLGSAIFMAVSTLQQSTNSTLDETTAFYQHDVQVQLENRQRVSVIEKKLANMPELAALEGWETNGARIIKSDDTEGATIGIVALPADSEMVRPRLSSGTWLTQSDSRQVVINTDVLDYEPHLKINDTIKLNLNGKEDTWTIVGIAKSQLNGPAAYVPYELYSRNYGRAGKASSLVMKAAPGVSQDELATAVESELRTLGISVGAVATVDTLQDGMRFQFGIVTMLLTVMSVLITAVGGFGLVGTMGMNVTERIREIGVMRSIGADTRTILNIVVVEGLVIGLISWAIGAAVSYPIGQALGNTIGDLLMDSPLTHSFSTTGVMMWFGVVFVLSTLASIMPALKAARLEVRETLAHV
ncbi:MAG: FtsX-like permease family protein [Anaerolineae bacterium]